MLGKVVEIHEGRVSMGGMFIYEAFISGEIVKVNAKSIRVKMGSCKRTVNGKVTCQENMNTTASFTFWKKVVREFGKNAGKTVSFYKNTKYGVIEIVEC